MTPLPDPAAALEGIRAIVAEFDGDKGARRRASETLVPVEWLRALAAPQGSNTGAPAAGLDVEAAILVVSNAMVRLGIDRAHSLTCDGNPCTCSGKLEDDKDMAALEKLWELKKSLRALASPGAAATGREEAGKEGGGLRKKIRALLEACNDLDRSTESREALYEAAAEVEEAMRSPSPVHPPQARERWICCPESCLSWDGGPCDCEAPEASDEKGGEG